MTTNGKSIGLLSFTFPVNSPLDMAMVKAKEHLAMVVAQRLGLTLTNLCIKEQLTKESTLDPLTGLFNRRHLATAFDRELRLASRGHRPVGVLMFDLDHFKDVNDKFGHAAADRILCEVAAVLRARLRADDVPARYGGDEAVVLLPDTTLDGACIVAEKLRLAVRALRVTYGGRALPPISISVGVGSYPASGADADAVLRAVDVALYKAKGAGRDRVAVASA
jgi:diguanylate cyclase (GGDEF)-like protein